MFQGFVRMDWNSLQVVTQGLTLKDLLHPKLVENLNNELDGKKIDVTNIRIKVSDEDIGNNVEVDFVTLFTRDLEDLLLNRIVVDVTNHENLDKIKSAIEKMED